MTLTITPLPGIPMIQEGDDLGELIRHSLNRAGIALVDGDILIIAQKVISKAEGRMVNLADITASTEAQQLAEKTGKDPRLVEVILRESSRVLRSKKGTIIVEHRLGFVCASAGIDHSNVKTDHPEHGEWVLLLPGNPDESAAVLRAQLEESSGKRIGVLIIDSHGRAWRLGTVGITIGISGVPGVVDLRGEPDLFGLRLQITEVGAADELAAAASLVMGQAAEGTPIVHVRGFPYPLRDSSLAEMIRPRSMDMFR
jgi:coenzyme F420-0:L-glutamate ligase/coenzyme F420-1:gamma-L-glutamate ligase